MDLSVRRKQAELMDAPGLDAGHHGEALRGLSRLNAIAGSAGALLRDIRSLPNPTGHALKVLDLGSGGGDVALALEAAAARQGIGLLVEGRDISEVAVRTARCSAARAASRARFVQCDLMSEDLPKDFDVIYCTLFLHHLDEDEALGLLRRMKESTRRMVIIHDLCRSRLGFLLAWLSARVFTDSHVVHADAPLSVEGAFTPVEAVELAERAGLAGVTVAKHWPERFSLTWRKE